MFDCFCCAGFSAAATIPYSQEKAVAVWFASNRSLRHSTAVLDRSKAHVRKRNSGQPILSQTQDVAAQLDCARNGPCSCKLLRAEALNQA